MPLTKFQSKIAKLLSVNRTPDSHLAGGAAIHFSPNSKRYSNDLDYFHDSVERVATAFEDDRRCLESDGYQLKIEMNQPGYIRAIVSKENTQTKIEWAHDSAWRFMPPIFNPDCGFQLHPVDLAINKLLALAGRDEPRDFLDVITIDKEILPLGALCWAAAGKDPGFTPHSLLELLKRRGRYHPEDFDKLQLTQKVDLKILKSRWLNMLKDAEAFIQTRPFSDVGCLYYSLSKKKFVAPDPSQAKTKSIIPHYGRPGGVLPKM